MCPRSVPADPRALYRSWHSACFRAAVSRLVFLPARCFLRVPLALPVFRRTALAKPVAPSGIHFLEAVLVTAMAILAGLSLEPSPARAQSRFDPLGNVAVPHEAFANQAERLPPIGSTVVNLPPGSATAVAASSVSGARVAVASFQMPETLPAPAGGFQRDDAGYAPPPADDGYGSANGVQYAFWGWLSYENSPQAGLSSFRAWEAEMDVTKTFTDRIAVAADIDLYDSNRDYWFTWSGSAIPHVEQLFLSLMLPNKNDTLVTFGKFNTPFGIERRDFWDRLTGSVSLLFLAQPEDLVGAMMTYAIPDANLVIRPMIVNGFNQNVDVNQQPSFAVMVQYQPDPNLTLAVTNWIGPEFNNDNHDKLYLINSQVTWAVTCKLKLRAEQLYVRTMSPTGVIQWSGAAVIANYDCNERCRVYAQWSLLDDPNGFVTDTRQQAQEFNVGCAYYLHPRVEFRLDYRHDSSHRNQNVDVSDYQSYYANSGAVVNYITAKSQDTIFLNATFGF